VPRAHAQALVSNLDMVEEAVRMVRDHGAEPASAADMRQALGS
jgi:3-keto-5-aminohexanoate cleavage enzyme